MCRGLIRVLNLKLSLESFGPGKIKLTLSNRKNPIIYPRSLASCVVELNKRGPRTNNAGRFNSPNTCSGFLVVVKHLCETFNVSRNVSHTFNFIFYFYLELIGNKNNTCYCIKINTIKTIDKNSFLYYNCLS